MTKQFGGSVSKALEQKYSQSPQWDGKKFVNLEETGMNIGLLQLPKLLYKQFFEKKGREPGRPLPIRPFDEAAFLAPSDRTKFVWYGHSVIVLRIANKTILIDPMFGPNAGPISPFPINRFSKDTLSLINALPEIDLVLLTHDHYDHLDLQSIEMLIPKVKEYYVALGCARHLRKWGITEERINEFDWWDSRNFGGISIAFTPTRHFSGRGLTDRAKSLWGGWTLKTDIESIYFSGDSGYGQHFKEVGSKLGPFDFAFMECGQYNENWHQIHMFPEEAVKAAKDAGAKRIMPVHWAAFALAQHGWKDPVERFVRASESHDLPYVSPLMGEVVHYDAHSNKKWWESY